MSRDYLLSDEDEPVDLGIGIFNLPEFSDTVLIDPQINCSSYNEISDFYEFHILGEELDDGIFGKVKRARYGTKDIAVKIINRDNMPAVIGEKFLTRELEILRKVQHPNIVQILRIFDYPRKVYIFMEYIERGNLYEFLQEKLRLYESEARYLFRQLVSAVKYLHHSNISHRDIKCENIMLTNKAEVKLIDFGFCKTIEKFGDLSSTFCGSTGYAAPEVLQGIPYDPFLYDIWSLGCVLYVMVIGTMPFDEKSVATLVEKQLNKDFSYPQTLQLSQSFLDLMDRMLEPEVLRRATILEVDRSPWLQTPETAVPDMSKTECGSADDKKVIKTSSDTLRMFSDSD